MIDCHSHVLPSIDDGSRSVEESIEILKTFHNEGITAVLATPHFYPGDDLETFMQKREQAYKELETALEKQSVQLPSIRLGAEVLLSMEMAKLADLDKLRIQGTRYILIEMPYTDWSHWVYEALYTIRAKYKLIPIIAHIERYVDIVSSLDKIQQLLAMDVVVQMNAYSLHRKHKRLAYTLIKKNWVHVLGSDVHRAKSAVPVSQGYSAIQHKYGKEVSQRYMANAQAVLDDQDIDKWDVQPIKKILGYYF